MAACPPPPEPPALEPQQPAASPSANAVAAATGDVFGSTGSGRQRKPTEAAMAAGTCARFLSMRTVYECEERCWVPHEHFEYEELLKEHQLRYKQAMQRLKLKFPDVEPYPSGPEALAEGDAADEHNSTPCVCGGRLACAPWVLWVKQLGFCDCYHACGIHIRMVGEWARAAGVEECW